MISARGGDLPYHFAKLGRQGLLSPQSMASWLVALATAGYLVATSNRAEA